MYLPNYYIYITIIASYLSMYLTIIHSYYVCRRHSPPRAQHHPSGSAIPLAPTARRGSSVVVARRLWSRRPRFWSFRLVPGTLPGSFLAARCILVDWGPRSSRRLQLAVRLSRPSRWSFSVAEWAGTLAASAAKSGLRAAGSPSRFLGQPARCLQRLQF